MANNRRKSAAIALAVLGVAGLTLASASQLNMSTSGTLQAGQVVLGDCQTATVPVTYTTSFSGGAYNVTAVNLGAIDAACAGKPLELKVLNTAGTVVGTYNVASLVAGSNAIAVSPVLPVASVKTVAAIING